MTQRDRGSATKRARQLHLRRVDWTTMKVDACEAWKKGKLGARLAGIDPRHGDAMREFGRVECTAADEFRSATCFAAIVSL